MKNKEPMKQPTPETHQANRAAAWTEKVAAVKKQLQTFKQVVIAFSGGKDSFFLLKLALETLGKENTTAVFVTTNFSTHNDEKRLLYFSGQLAIDLVKLDLDLSKDKLIMSNPRERCYHCKKKIFTAIQSVADAVHAAAVLDGTTYSDLSQYRPGLKALAELHVVSPLLDAGITSAEIVSHLERDLGTPPYFLTASTCLATRFPYDMELTGELLSVYDQIEAFLVEQGIFPLKIRFIPEGIRIETAVGKFPEVLAKKEMITTYCRGLAIKFVTLDLEGIKTGVWD